jgi:hypothetical protein
MAEESEKKEKKIKLVAVKTVLTQGQSTVVEFRQKGRLQRVIVPVEKVVDGQADELTLSAGLPYGLPWHKAKVEVLTGESVEDALHDAGIWTQDDLFTKPAAVHGALQVAYGLALGALIEIASQGGK